MLNNLFGSTDLLKLALDGSWAKNRVIANNIANADTAGFKASSVNFEDTLKHAIESTSGIKTTRENHITPEKTAGVTITENKDTSYRMDGNNVDMDKEQADLAANQIYYNLMSTKLNSELNKLRLVINEGR